MRLQLVALLVAGAVLPTALGGPITFLICPTACNIGAATCYTAAGFTFGTVFAAVAPAAILACNAAQGTCMAACAASMVLPVP